MWRVNNNCGCNNVINEPIEFEIPDIFNSDYYHIPNYLNSPKNIQELKQKIICEYYQIINKLECGIQPDLEFLLEEISLVEINNGLRTIL